MEPLEALVQRITGRRRQKAQYTPVEFEEVGGSMRGLPAGIAAADDMQSYDLGSAVPPTQPIFARGDEDSGPETPVQLASGGQGQSNPFRFASQTEQPQIRQTSGPVQYRKVCGANGCRMVPVGGDEISYGGGQLFNNMQAPSQALPPGVTLGPGETFVEGSLREVPKPFQATPSTPQPMAAQPAPATTQPTASPTASQQPQSASEILEDLARRVEQDYQRYDSEAARYYSDADAALAQRNAIGFMQYDERGDRAAQAGINARELYYTARAAVANQMNVERAASDRQERDRRKTLEGRLDDEAAIMAARGKSIGTRVQQLFEIRTGVAAAQQQPMTEEYATKLRDMIEGEIYATDSSGYFLDYVGARNRFKSSNGQDESALRDAVANRAEAFGLMLRRYGDAEDREALDRRMRAELTPIFRARFEDYFKDNPELVPNGMTGGRVGQHVNAEALRSVDTSIARVAQYLETGASPYDDEALRVQQPRSYSPTPPARSVNPRFDEQMVE